MWYMWSQLSFWRVNYISTGAWWQYWLRSVPTLFLYIKVFQNPTCNNDTLFYSGRQRAKLSHILPDVLLCSPARVQESKTVWVFVLFNMFNLIHWEHTSNQTHIYFFIVLSYLVSADKFQYTCMGGEITIEGVDDKKDMEETRRTFTLLGKNCLSCQELTLFLCLSFDTSFTFLFFLLQGWRRTSSQMCSKFWQPFCIWEMWKSKPPVVTNHQFLWVSTLQLYILLFVCKVMSKNYHLAPYKTWFAFLPAQWSTPGGLLWVAGCERRGVGALALPSEDHYGKWDGGEAGAQRASSKFQRCPRQADLCPPVWLYH